MSWFNTVQVSWNERVVVLRDGLPWRALGPGKHCMRGGGLSEVRWTTDVLLFDAAPELRAVIPRAWYLEAELGERARALLYRDGRPHTYLGQGTHRYWNVDPTLELRVYALDEPLPPLEVEPPRMIAL
jgi:hypothetical protein